MRRTFTSHFHRFSCSNTMNSIHVYATHFSISAIRPSECSCWTAFNYKLEEKLLFCLRFGSFDIIAHFVDCNIGESFQLEICCRYRVQFGRGQFYSKQYDRFAFITAATTSRGYGRKWVWLVAVAVIQYVSFRISFGENVVCSCVSFCSVKMSIHFVLFCMKKVDFRFV